MPAKLSFAFLLLSLPMTLVAEDPGSSRRVGRYEVALRLPPDGLYAGGEVEIEMRVEAAGAVVIRARVEAAIDMPAMPGMPAYREIAHAEDVPGVYGVHPCFAHAGDYRLHVSVTPPAEESFQVELPLRVLDADAAPRRKPAPPRFQMELLAAPKSPTASVEAELRIVVRDRERPRKIVASFEPMHEKLLHLLIVRADLGEFAHVHPEMGLDGVFRIRHVFRTAGEYHLFAEVAPLRAGVQTMMARLRVSGHSVQKFDLSATPRSPVCRVAGVEIELNSPRSVPIHKLIALRFSLRNSATAAPIHDLEPYIGAMGHLILIHQDGVTFVHSHPDERASGLVHDGVVPFLARFPKPGLYRAWCQFQRQGTVLTGEFVVEAGGAVE